MGCLLQTSAFSENPAGTVPARNTQSSRCIRTAKKTTSLSDPCLSRDTSRGTSDSSRDDGRRVERKIPDSPVVDADRCVVFDHIGASSDVTWASCYGIYINNRQLHCLFNRLFRHTSKKASKLSTIGPLWRESTGDHWIFLTKGQ